MTVEAASPTSAAEFSPVTAMLQMSAAAEGERLCGLGYHAWMPWLAVPDLAGAVSYYATYCVRCRHPEQFDS